MFTPLFPLNARLHSGHTTPSGGSGLPDPSTPLNALAQEPLIGGTLWLCLLSQTRVTTGRGVDTPRRVRIAPDQAPTSEGRQVSLIVLIIALSRRLSEPCTVGDLGSRCLSSSPQYDFSHVRSVREQDSTIS